MRKYVWLLVALIILLDQSTKFLAVARLTLNSPNPVIPNVFNLTLIYNTGGAFGIFRDKSMFFISLSILAIVYILFYLKIKKYTLWKEIAIGFILGGVAGNLIDRARFGYVIDFLDFRIWPIFNIADSAITIGVGLLIVLLFLKK